MQKLVCFSFGNVKRMKNKYDAEYLAPQKCGTGRPLYGAAGAYMMQCRRQLREEAKVQGQMLLLLAT